MKRTYLKGTWPIYDDHFDRLVKASPLLNGKGTTFLINQNLGDKKGLEHALFLLTGDENGKIKDRYNDVLTASIPYLQLQLKEVDARFEYYQRNRTALGNRPVGDEIADWPAEYRNDKLRIQAELDVKLSEKAELEKRIKDFVTEEVTVHDKQVEKLTLQGIGTLRAGVLVEMDGCPVLHINNRLIMGGGIYEGMEVADYKDLIKVYKQAIDDANQQKFVKQQEAAKRDGRPVPQRMRVQHGTRPSPSLLPAWPVGVRNYKKDPETGYEIEPEKKPARAKQMNVQVSNM